jgi:hypothetical protein
VKVEEKGNVSAGVPGGDFGLDELGAAAAARSREDAGATSMQKLEGSLPVPFSSSRIVSPTYS